MRPMQLSTGFPIGALLLALVSGLVIAFVSIVRRITRGPHDGPDRWRSHRRR
jgi:hypothetical protein